MTLVVISHSDCLLHDVGEHPERPDRIKVIQNALSTYPFTAPVLFQDAQSANEDHLRKVHNDDYLKWIMSVAPKAGFIAIEADTIMNQFTLNAALLAAGSMVQGIDLLFNQKAQTVFCNVRPPGHHAERDRAMGFCFFNNVAVGAQYAIDQYQLDRIAIIDFDVHHGNGTQNIFQNNKKVMFCSSFQHPFYPGYDPELDNEHILNIPLVAGTSGQQFREQVASAWFDQLDQFRPQLICFSAGFDAHELDPLGGLRLVRDDYVWLTTEIARIAKTHCPGKLISILEGGYDLTALAECVPAHIDAIWQISIGR